MARLEAILSPRGCQVTAIRDSHVAARWLGTGHYDALLISERLFHGDDRPHTLELVELAARREILIVPFPSDHGPILPPVVRLTAPPDGQNGRKGSRDKRQLDRKRVEKIFEETIRPAFQAKGGDVELINVMKGHVYLRFLGVCGVCPVVRNGHLREIEEFLKRDMAGVKAVVVEQNGFPPGRWW